MGLKAEWFQDKPRFPHYDVRGSRMRGKAMLYGAREVSQEELVMRCRRGPAQGRSLQQVEDGDRCAPPDQLTLWGE